MSEHRNELDRLMSEHKLTARDVCELLDRKRTPHTVRCWRSAWKGRQIPADTLALLKSRLAQQGAA